MSVCLLLACMSLILRHSLIGCQDKEEENRKSGSYKQQHFFQSASLVTLFTSLHVLYCAHETV